MTEKLKPCPFCGCIIIIHSGYHMYCHACGAEGPDADSDDESAAIKAWNRRAQPTQPSAEPVAWTHGCAALLTNIELWIDACPHCGKPRTSSNPPARVPLTDEELRMISKQQDPVVVLHHNVLAFAHAIIAAYEAKNGIGGGK